MNSLDTFEPVLLEAAGIDHGHTLESYRSRGGYAPIHHGDASFGTALRYQRRYAIDHPLSIETYGLQSRKLFQ